MAQLRRKSLPSSKVDSPHWMNSIIKGDCVAALEALPANSVDVVFADPPYNIGFKYDVYDDRLNDDSYLQWTSDWINAANRILKPTGAFWIAIGDEYVAELKMIAEKAEIGRASCRERV